MDTAISHPERGRTICDCFKYRTKMDSELFKQVNELMQVMLGG